MMLEIVPCPLISANAEVYVGIGCCNTLTLVDLQITFPSRTPCPVLQVSHSKRGDTVQRFPQPSVMLFVRCYHS